MAKRVTDAERARIIAAFETGKSCNQIAKEFNRASRTISLIARDVGHKFTQVNTEHARALKAKYDEERRQQIRLNTVDKAERVLEQMFDQSLVFNFGGKDNTYNEHTIDKPTYRDQQYISQTFKNLMGVVLEYDKREIGEHDSSILDAIYERIQSEADAYEPASNSEGETGMEHPGG